MLRPYCSCKLPFGGRLLSGLMLHSFHEHYGRWVAFKDIAVNDLLRDVRRSPLLLCACCLIAVRHTTEELASAVAPRMFEEAKSLFSKALLVVPQTFDFFQATVILSMWSTTIGQVLLSVDSWLSSGFALQHSLASDVFRPVKSRSAQMTRQDLGSVAVWNNLCLTHLQYRKLSPSAFLLFFTDFIQLFSWYTAAASLETRSD
mgnify:CR=1 FL=1